MTQTSTGRRTCVLMVGLTENQWSDKSRVIEDNLRSARMGWTFSSNPARSLEAALAHLSTRADVEVVMLCEEFGAGRQPEQVAADAAELAAALAEHQNMPMVWIERKFEYLRPIFKSAGLIVEGCSIEVAIFGRWAAQQQFEAV